MEEKLKKFSQRLLWWGAFPEDRNNIHGGIVTSCQDLMEFIKFPDEKLIFTFDSTHKSNPIPNFFLRLFYSSIRFLKVFLSSFIQKARLSTSICICWSQSF